MLGIKFIKVQPTDYVLLFKNGRLSEKAPVYPSFTSNQPRQLYEYLLQALTSPFIFKEVTSDFQEVYRPRASYIQRHRSKEAFTVDEFYFSAERQRLHFRRPSETLPTSYQHCTSSNPVIP